MKTHIGYNKFTKRNVIFVPCNDPREIQLFVERLAILQSNVNSIKPTFTATDIDGEAYFEVRLYDYVIDCFVDKDRLEEFTLYTSMNLD